MLWYDQRLKTHSFLNKASIDVPTLLMPSVSLSTPGPSFRKICRADQSNPFEGLLLSRLLEAGKALGPITD